MLLLIDKSLCRRYYTFRKGIIMEREKTHLLAVIVLVITSIANANPVLTVNGFDTSVPVEINADVNIIIGINYPNDVVSQNYIVTCEVGGKLTPLSEPNSSSKQQTTKRYLLNFDNEQMSLATVNLTVNGILDYQLAVFKVPDANIVVFGIDLNIIEIPEPESETQPKAADPAVQIAIVSQLAVPEESGTQRGMGTPIYGSSFCPDLVRDNSVDFKDFAVLAENWFETGTGLDGDFDESGKVDEVDLSNFTAFWLNTEPIVAEDKNAIVTENSAVIITLNAHDCNGTTDFVYDLVERPENGIIAIDANRAIYCPDINFVGEDYFTYIAQAGDYNSSIATVEITVRADTDDDGLSDYDEINGTYGYVTDPCDPNSDGDIMPDGWEVHYGLNPTIDNSSSNPDNDGLTNEQEYLLGTEPDNADSDYDGLKDGDEVSGNLSSYGPDWPFADNYPSYYDTPFVENPYNTPLDPLNEDTDEDGVLDGKEIDWGLDPNNPDTDGDGVDDGTEVGYGDNNVNVFKPWPLWNYLYLEDLDDCDMNPNNNDTDSDGMNDRWEHKYARLDPAGRELDPRYGGDPGNDTDNDGLVNNIECSLNLSSEVPDGWDTDGDGLSDSQEYYGTVTGYATNPNNVDSDGDFLIDGYNNTLSIDSYPDGVHEYYGGSSSYVFGEASIGSNPTSSNSDSDNMPDGWEVRNWNMVRNSYFDPIYNYSGVPNSDFDNDGLTNLTESQEWTLAQISDTDSDGANDGYEKNTLGTKPLKADTDKDGLKDGQEASHGADPLDYDTDDDLLPDGWEVEYGLNPAVSDVFYVDINDDNWYIDSDNDDLDDFEEFIYGTDPKDWDSDNDGVKDGIEVAQGSDPLDKNDKIAPPAKKLCEVKLTVGDHSSSESERYILQVGPVRHMATEFGEVQSRVYKFKTGRFYKVQVLHVDSTINEPDYDYTANITAVDIPTGAMFHVYDPKKILGVHGDWGDTPNFHAEGKEAKLVLARPKRLDIIAGDYKRKVIKGRRYYYHQVYDEDGKIINIEGIPCDEIVRYRLPLSKRGKRKRWGVSGGITKNWPDEDGDWNGGIAIRDTLTRNIYASESMVLTQTILVGGIAVEPNFIMEFNMQALDDNDKITKKADN